MRGGARDMVEDDAPAGVQGGEGMTARDFSGDAHNSPYRKAMRIADRAELTGTELAAIAEGVREFDTWKSPEHRTAAALEKIASKVGPEKDSAAYEAGRLRRREVYALELAAVGWIGNEEDIAAVRESTAYKNLVARLAGRDAPA